MEVHNLEGRDGHTEDEPHEESPEDGEDSIPSDSDGFVQGMDPQGYIESPEKIVKPLTQEDLAAFKAAQESAGVIYISRIPPGMQPAKVRHLMSAYGEIGRVYLQQEGTWTAYPTHTLTNACTADAKSAYLRRKYTTTKKPHFVEGWVEFKDKRVARSVAEMLNAEPIGGKKGTRWRDDVWTMKYLPRFKWNMLTEQVGA
jgi:ESF2/ABP1 family protein